MPRNRSVAVACSAASLACVFLIPTAPAHAAGSIHLYKIYYDSPGSDTRSNTSLNAEYVQIRNTTGAAFQMKGYTLRDAAGHKYTFPSYRISAGKTVKVHTGRGTTSPGHLYQGRRAYVWNNDKDSATLRKPSGAVRDTCGYNSTRADYRMC